MSDLKIDCKKSDGRTLNTIKQTKKIRTKEIPFFIPTFSFLLSHLTVENAQAHCGESKCSQTTYFKLLNTFGHQL